MIARLRELGFTYDEAQSLRRIEMTLQRWAERECGDGSDWAIERDDKIDKPFNVYHGEGKARRYAIADKEKGALKRLAAIVGVRNGRVNPPIHVPDAKHGAVIQSNPATAGNALISYHQSDPRGCMVYLVKASDISDGSPIDSVYTRGVAVCT